MKTLIVFAYPAPYKIAIFNELTKYMDLDVIFERDAAKSRPSDFYSDKEILFNIIKIKGIKVGEENTFSLSVKRYIKKNYKKYDAIIMNGYATFAEIFALKYMQKHNIPYIEMINGGVIHSQESNRKKALKTKLLKGAKFYLSPNDSSSEYLKYYGVDQSLIKHYHYSNISENNIVKPLTKKQKYTLRKEKGLNDKLLIVAASQFSERKNNEPLIRAMKHIDGQLLLIGDGPLKERYVEIIKSEKIDNVTIMPFMKRDELFSYYNIADYFISLSKEDIYGHTIIEALANNIPVIATNTITSAKDIIVNGKNGYLLDNDNENSIINAINALKDIKNDDLSSYVKDYTIENTAKEIYNYIK